ncbi:hypothetical protein IC1_06125 [Bacillus cereus VD022]|uniref:Mga helix-turn-helix domain-containing protein n=2 Tax=Bacillus cereus TaxID=1396 RepID=A0ABC9SPQ8_BACCE|nr:hypothetical protein IC1_06125 [Bacillus cereus VD022]EOQ57205.1 hypothetical protein IAY_05803 [Bacillus cereus TIAC219]
MDNIIHDKSTKRKISILKILNNNKEFVSANFLASHLKCSNRTILNTIFILKNEIPSNWEIISIKSKGYMLRKPSDENFNFIMQLYLKESTIYNLLLGIFNGKHYTFEKWSQLLYINKITLKNIIRQFNIFLGSSGLKLKVQSKILKLEGNELNIRYFYIAFFTLTLKYGEEFTSLSYVKNEMNIIIQYHKVKIDSNLLLSILRVFTKRNFQHKFLAKKIENKIILDTNQTSCFEEIVFFIEYYFKINIQQNEINFMKLCFFLASNSTITQKKIVLNEVIQQNIAYDILFNYIKKKNKLSTYIANNLAVEISIYLYKLDIMKNHKLPIQFFVNSLNFISNVHYQLYKKNYRFIYSWNKKYGKLVNRFESQYVTAQVATFLYANPIKINILLLFSGTALEEKLIFLKLRRNLSENINIHRDFDLIKNYDLIVTNYPVSKSDIPVIYIFQNGSEKEITAIKSKVM